MSLTSHRGPLGADPYGRANVELPDQVLYLEPSPKRVRARLGDEFILDTRRAHLLHETGREPVWYVPEDAVRPDLLRANGRRRDDGQRGLALLHDLRSGSRAVTDAAWSYEHPSMLAGLLALDWDVPDAWYEEDEEVLTHPRDPYHRIDVHPVGGEVRIHVNGEEVARSRAAKVLYETTARPRYYVPATDVRPETLQAGTRRTGCPYKGEARYRSVLTADGLVPDVAWVYADPHHDAAAVRGHLAFHHERDEVQLELPRG